MKKCVNGEILDMAPEEVEEYEKHMKTNGETDE